MLEDAARLEWPVRVVTQDRGGVTVSGERGEIQAQRAIVAIPPTLAGRLVYEPALPSRRDQLTQRLPAGSVIKFHVIYATSWWRDLGLSGFLYSPDERVSVVFDGSPPNGKPGVLVGFLEGKEGVAGAGLTPTARRAMVTEVLARGFGDAAHSASAYVDCDWSAEEWTRGCYGAHFPPGAWTQFGPTLREPLGRIHWAGTETAEHWMGYVDGAIESGIRAAREALESPD